MLTELATNTNVTQKYRTMMGLIETEALKLRSPSDTPFSSTEALQNVTNKANLTVLFSRLDMNL